MQGFADNVKTFLECSLVKGLSDGLGYHPLNADDKDQEEQELNDFVHLNEKQWPKQMMSGETILYHHPEMKRGLRTLGV